MKKIYIILFSTFLTFSTTNAQVGIGTTSPEATLHIVGTTTPVNIGGIVELLNEDFAGYTLTQDNSSSGCSINGWRNTTSGYYQSNCNNCSGNWLYINSDGFGCTQNATAIIALTASPTSTNITISFDYRYNDYNGNADRFRVYLWDENTSSQVGPDLINTVSDANTNYTGSTTVIPGHNYSLRFRYNGYQDYGASVDNILVTEMAPSNPGSYTFKLEDGQQMDGYVLTSDANGNGTWMAPGSVGTGTDNQTIDIFSLSGNTLSLSLENDGEATKTVDLSGLSGGGSNAANNGLSKSGSTIQLGGDLIKNTTINLKEFNLTFETNPLALFPGEIIFKGQNRTVMQTNLEDNYVNFGNAGTEVDGDDGYSFTDSGGDTYTRDFVAGFHKSGSGGTAIAMGSIEYFVDGLDELLFEGSGIHPLTDGSGTLGAANKRWNAVYANTGYFTTSDIRYKKNIMPLNYGLQEIMKLKTISYKWKDNTIGKTKIPQNTK